MQIQRIGGRVIAQAADQSEVALRLAAQAGHVQVHVEGQFQVFLVARQRGLGIAEGHGQGVVPDFEVTRETPVQASLHLGFVNHEFAAHEVPERTHGGASTQCQAGQHQ